MLENHPHLLFSKNEIDRLCKRIQNGKRSKLYLEHAIRYCEESIDPNSDFYFDYKERKKTDWKNDRSIYVSSARLITLALVGWLADRPSYRTYAAQVMIHFLNHKVMNDYGSFTNNKPPLLGHHEGKYFMMMAILYDLLYDELGVNGRKLMEEQADRSFTVSDQLIGITLHDIDNNRGLRALLGIATLALTMRKVSKNKSLIEAYLRRFSNWFEMGIRTNFGIDGVPFEGAHYGGSILSQLYVTARIMKNNGFKDCSNDQRFYRMADFVIHQTTPQGWINNLNDSNDRDASMECMYMAGVFFNNPAALWHWDTYNLKNVNHSIQSITHPEYIPNDMQFIPFCLLWPDDHALDPLPPKEAGYPNTLWFRERGIVSMRSGWENEDLHVTLKSGREERANHQNADQNQVTVYALNENFIIDTGYPKGIPDVSAISPEAHNIIFVDGHSQYTKRDQAGFPRGAILDFKVGNGFTYALGDAKEAYLKKGTLHRAERHVQTVWDERMPPHIVWADDIDFDGKEHEYTLLLHTSPNNHIKVSDNIITIFGKENAMDLHFQTTNSVDIKIDSYNKHPCIKLTQRGTRVRYVMLLHPYRPNEPKLVFSSTIEDETIKVNVKSKSKCVEHKFDCSENPLIPTAEPRPRVAPLKWIDVE